MLQRIALGGLLWIAVAFGEPLVAQDRPALDREYVVGTVTRPPFSMEHEGQHMGFSISLWHALAEDLELTYRFQRYDTFGAMLNAVEAGEVDAAIANISITAERETRLDFTQPIFESGLQVMIHGDKRDTLSALRSALTPRVLLFAFGGIVLLFAVGMLMWFLERKRHALFGETAKEALFPSFWWALNLVVSGGYEEAMPRSPLGRIFGVVMVVCSLFVVSVFVANITATMTLDALQEDVTNITDLDGRRVGTTAGSTTSIYLDIRGIQHRTYDNLPELLQAFEADELEAVVFDGPILAYYVQNSQHDDARLLDRVFQQQGYGIALPTGSALREPLDRALLRLREGGEYDALKAEWFGPAYSDG